MCHFLFNDHVHCTWVKVLRESYIFAILFVPKYFIGEYSRVRLGYLADIFLHIDNTVTLLLIYRKVRFSLGFNIVRYPTHKCRIFSKKKTPCLNSLCTKYMPQHATESPTYMLRIWLSTSFVFFCERKICNKINEGIISMHQVRLKELKSHNKLFNVERISVWETRNTTES